MEQLELFPIKLEEADGWFQSHAILRRDGMDGKVIKNHSSLHSPYTIGGDYLLIRFEDNTFIALDCLMRACAVDFVLTRESIIFEQFNQFFTPLEMNYIRELRKQSGIK